VLEEGVRALRELGGEGEIVAAIGPAAGPCCYEVGEEVHAVFASERRQGRNLDLPVLPSDRASECRQGRNLDLPALARDRLLVAGVARVERRGGCTICDERYFSHRREGARAGRQAAVAWLASDAARFESSVGSPERVRRAALDSSEASPERAQSAAGRPGSARGAS
jgi:copper oxidase (laccase) domain-containing protein